VQAGHREQYGIPRALQRVGALDKLITDVWAPPRSLVSRLAGGRLGRRMSDRFHSDLPAGKVRSFPWRMLAWESAARLRGMNGDQRTLAHNDWWTATAATALRREAGPFTRYVFGYCYAARALFSAARELGLTPVLGQMDPGPVQDRKVTQIVRQWSDYKTPFQPGTQSYYESWYEECRLAGHIVVNSQWSRQALEQAGIDARKIAVIPLVYSPPAEAGGWIKTYPASYSQKRPLRVLSLGRCILLKGVAETIAAAQSLWDQPVEFTFVGNTDIVRLESHFGRARIRYFPRVSRAECHAFYRAADVFLFPTHADGFGLTQLEAQAWRLPIIASRFCAEVVEPGRTGWVLPEVSADSIVQAITGILADPAVLVDYSRTIAPWPFGLEQLGRHLAMLGDSPP
jgi:glycosyltransferase involved in cell wall biosynthesis